MGVVIYSTLGCSHSPGRYPLTRIRHSILLWRKQLVVIYWHSQQVAFLIARLSVWPGKHRQIIINVRLAILRALFFFMPKIRKVLQTVIKKCPKQAWVDRGTDQFPLKGEREHASNEKHGPCRTSSGESTYRSGAASAGLRKRDPASTALHGPFTRRNCRRQW